MSLYTTGESFSIPSIRLPKVVQNINTGSTRSNGIVTPNDIPNQSITSVFMPICNTKRSVGQNANLLTDGLDPHQKSASVNGPHSFASNILSCCLLVDSPSPPLSFQYFVNRLQWNENSGYCGETSFITAAMYFGMYISQWDMRSFSNPGIDQSDPGSQLLLSSTPDTTGVTNAINLLQFKADNWIDNLYFNNDPGNTQFINWMSGYTNPVIIGLYDNPTYVGGEGDPTYDHIVPVYSSVQTSISFSDNGLYGEAPPNQQPIDPFNTNTNWTGYWTNTIYNESPQIQSPFVYTYSPIIINDRVGANNQNGSVYSIPQFSDSVSNYGIAITGIQGESELQRIQVVVNSQEPDFVNGQDSNTRPPAAQMQLTLYFYNLNFTQNQVYNLYCYTNPGNHPVPTSNFNLDYTTYNNSNPGQEDIILTQLTTANLTSLGNSYSYVDPNITLTSNIALYRCVSN